MRETGANAYKFDIPRELDISLVFEGEDLT